MEKRLERQCLVAQSRVRRLVVAMDYFSRAAAMFILLISGCGVPTRAARS